MGNLIPAGTGLDKYKKIQVYNPMDQDVDDEMIDESDNVEPSVESGDE
jgi:hypothetical protein